MASLIQISIVSHGQEALVNQLLASLATLRIEANLQLCVTHNIEPSEALNIELLGDLVPTRNIIVQRNKEVRGFGANHNQAFGLLRQLNNEQSRFFCVLNPDISFRENPFDLLSDCLLNDSSIGVVR
jgi:GT2 family glycosyltransferase